MSTRPPPLIRDPKLDLSGLEWFPFKHRQLLRSEFWTRSSDQVCRISVELWCHAWNEVPCSSLPNEDGRLAQMAGFGKDVAAWKRVRRAVMDAWVLCSDGRWYHPTLADIALERAGLREKWRSKKQRQREVVCPQGQPGDNAGTSSSPLISTSSDSETQQGSPKKDSTESQDVTLKAALTVIDGGRE